MGWWGLDFPDLPVLCLPMLRRKLKIGMKWHWYLCCNHSPQLSFIPILDILPRVFFERKPSQIFTHIQHYTTSLIQQFWSWWRSSLHTVLSTYCTRVQTRKVRKCNSHQPIGYSPSHKVCIHPKPSKHNKPPWQHSPTPLIRYNLNNFCYYEISQLN